MATLPDESGLEQDENEGSTSIAGQAVETPARCMNCGAELQGEWCYECGQRQARVDRFFGSLVSEILDDVFAWDSRARRTLVSLLFRPGTLTKEYFAGRRARYVPPLRLYLITSVAFFFVMGIESWFAPPQPMLQIYRTDMQQGAQQAEVDNWREELPKVADSIHFDSLSPERNQAIRERVKNQLIKAGELGEKNPRELLNAILNMAPPVMFALVPIFALFLKAAYMGSGRYYSEHLILAVHNHSFLFVALIFRVVCSYVGFLSPGLQHVGSDIITFWILAYMYWSLIVIYKQGYVVTLFKFFALNICYVFLFGLGMATSVMLGVMTL